MRHFIYDAALHAASRFAAHEFLFLYGLHKILSIQLQDERRRNRRSPRHERPDEIGRPFPLRRGDHPLKRSRRSLFGGHHSLLSKVHSALLTVALRLTGLTNLVG